MYSTQILSSKEELEEAKPFQFSNFYLAKRRFMKINLKSKCFQSFAIFLGYLIYKFINLNIFLSIIIGYCILLAYVFLYVHFVFHSRITNDMDYGRFVEFWSQQSNCMMGLYETKNEIKKLIGVVGIILIQLPARCELRRMWICEAYRRYGLGTMLLNFTFNEARRLNYRRIELVTRLVLNEANEFYLKNGFQLTRKVEYFTTLPFNTYIDLYYEKQL